jgi:hypothetical protein
MKIIPISFAICTAIFAFFSCKQAYLELVRQPVIRASTVSFSQPYVFPQLAHIIHMGQSLGSGDDAFPVVTVADTVYGNLQFARGVHTWRRQLTMYCEQPELRPMDDFKFTAITGGDTPSRTGETIASGLTDTLRASLSKSVNTRFLFSFSGMGSKRLHDLDRDHDATTDPRSLDPSPGGFYKTSIDDVKRAQAQAAVHGWTYGVAAITWMQGEKNNDMRLDDWSAPLDRAAFLARWANDLITLKNEWNADVQRITKQSSRIPLFSYQTWGSVTGQAQLLASDLDSEIYVVSPTYYMYSALNSANPFNGQWGNWIHLNGDSERWLGAQFAKVIRRVLVDREPWKPLRPVKAWVSADRAKIYVRYHVPRPPIVIDNNFMPAAPGAGLNIPGGPVITRVEVSAPDSLTLHLASALPVGNYTVEYASQHGNSDYLLKPGKIQSVTPVSALANGHAAYRLTFAGDLTNQLTAIIARGVFYLQSTAGDSTMANGVIRSVAIDSNGNTVMTGENGELRNGVQFAAGQSVVIRSIVPSGNIRDSDTETSPYKFAGGPRAGQAYPLWNWSVSFEDLIIDDGP